MSIELTVSDFGQVYDDLRSLGFADQKKVLVKAAKEGAAVIAERAEQLAPIDTGTLRDEMMVTTAGTKSDINAVTVLFGPSTRAYYGGFQELGTSHHPDQAFIQPAVEAREEEAMQIVIGVLEAEINKVLRG